jgi:hypothetical protein
MPHTESIPRVNTALGEGQASLSGIARGLVEAKSHYLGRSPVGNVLRTVRDLGSAGAGVIRQGEAERCG